MEQELKGMRVGHGSTWTPAPWVVFDADGSIGTVEDASGLPVAQAQMRGTLTKHNHDERRANARLIAAAPDHALICWAMCVGAGRWEPWGDGRGEFCINGIRHATRLDEFGAPAMTDGMRAAILKAKGCAHD